MKIVVRSDIAAPPAAAFAKLCDCRNETKWNTKVTTAELVSGEPVGVGTQFHTTNRGKPYSATIQTFEEPSKLVFDVKGAPSMVASFTLTEAGEGCVLDGELDMKPTGFLKLLFPMIRSGIQKDADKQYQNFARFVETGVPQT